MPHLNFRAHILFQVHDIAVPYFPVFCLFLSLSVLFFLQLSFQVCWIILLYHLCLNFIHFISIFLCYFMGCLLSTLSYLLQHNYWVFNLNIYMFVSRESVELIYKVNLLLSPNCLSLWTLNPWGFFYLILFYRLHQIDLWILWYSFYYLLFLLILPCTVHCLMQLMVQACMLIHVWLLATSWTVARQTPVHGIFQARVLGGVAISFSRGSSQPRNQTHVSLASYIGRKILYRCATWKAPYIAHNFRLCEIVFSRDCPLPNWCVPCILQRDVSS